MPSHSTLARFKLFPIQLEAYHREGFLLVENVFSQAELDTINREIELLRTEK